MSKNRPIVPRGLWRRAFRDPRGLGRAVGRGRRRGAILAAMNARPYTPLGRPAVESLLTQASVRGGATASTGSRRRPASGAGPRAACSDLAVGHLVRGERALAAWSSGTGCTPARTCYEATGDGNGWYPRFDHVLNAAAGVSWGPTDLFPDYGMGPLPKTQEGWRWCVKCQGCSTPAAARRLPGGRRP